MRELDDKKQGGEAQSPERQFLAERFFGAIDFQQLQSIHKIYDVLLRF